MTICTLTGCGEVEARDAYNRAEGDVLRAIDSILFIGKPLPEITKRPREDINEHEEHLNKMRKTMEAIDGNIAAHRSTTLNPLADAEVVEMLDHHEETVQQSNCLPEYPQSSMGVMGQTQGTVCR